MEALKRKRNSSEPVPQDSKRQRNICKYGMKCFRRNAEHLKNFVHPHLEKLLAIQTNATPNGLDPELNTSVIKDQLRIMKQYKIATSPKQFSTPKNPILSTPNRLKAGASEVQSPVEKPVIELFKNQNMRHHRDESAEILTSNLISSSSNPSTSSGSITSGSSRAESAVSKKKVASSSSSSSSDVGTATKRTDEKYDIHDFFPVVAQKGLFANKLANAAPFNIFYTTITDSPLTHSEPFSVTFQELLDRSLGNLKNSLQLNFMVDVSWLIAQYIFAGYKNSPMTILYGADDNDLKTISKKIPSITAVKVKMADAFGTHHTKVMIFEYEDGSMRVVVSTANLYEDDWHNRVQGLWISPTCPPLPNSEGSNSDEGNGPTNFKKDLLNYLNTYKLSALQEWIAKVRRTDFSHINVFLVVSVPGTHRGIDFDKYGHPHIASLLSKHCTIPNEQGWNPNEWSILCQCSSIGSLGPKPDSWFTGQIRTSFSRLTQKLLMNQPPSISVIYPTFENVRKSHDHLLGGGCLPYNRTQHEKQQWLENYLCQWKAESKNRNRAMPHIKSYCRVSPDLSQLAWFHLTSANLSKAAWGHIPVAPGEKRITIRSYEVGVLFLPSFVTKDSKFLLDNGCSVVKDRKMIFPFPYDLPLTPYSKTDGPFFMNILRE